MELYYSSHRRLIHSLQLMLAVITISPGSSSKKKEEESKETTKLTPADYGEMMRKVWGVFEGQQMTHVA